MRSEVIEAGNCAAASKWRGPLLRRSGSQMSRMSPLLSILQSELYSKNPVGYGLFCVRAGADSLFCVPYVAAACQDAATWLTIALAEILVGPWLLFIGVNVRAAGA